MNEYLATFYTHAGALVSDRSLKERGVSARMMPVPRKLSSSCGTCVRYEAQEPLIEVLDDDKEAVYRVKPGDDALTDYVLLASFE